MSVVITANLKDLLGIANPGSVRFELRGYSTPPTVSGVCISNAAVIAVADGSGAISQTLLSNADISPSGTFYVATFYNALGAFVTTKKYTFTSNTDLSS
jgi:hypothetical protein